MRNPTTLFLITMMGACAPRGPEVGNLQQGIEGRAGTYEFAADAPWRMEPSSFWGSLSYGAIPIQMAIHDADIQHLDSTWSVNGTTNSQCAPGMTGCYATRRRLVAVQSVTVTELPLGTARSFALRDLHEIEFTTGPWHVQSTYKPPPARTLCRRWAGEDCSGMGRVDSTSEWHATLMYSPAQSVVPGGEVRLKIEIRVSQRDDSGAFGSVPDAVLTQHVSVHYGEAPLPKFSDDWAYGDLHYHSQGTDNEGESAHSYRGVVLAMSALGLDFSFASDHASASEQIMAADIGLTNSFYYEDTLRDTDEVRFAYSLQSIQNPGGANASVLSMPRYVRQDRLRVPQLFLGGEVDVLPETAPPDPNQPRYQIPFGNDRLFDFNSCSYPAIGAIAVDNKGGCGNPPNPELLINPTADGRWLLKDLQGLADPSYFARQHMLHLPFDPGNADGFLASHTSKFGGATRRLRDLLAEEDATHKGVIFLAHPLAGATGSDFDRMAGPDLIPYSRAQLDEAFASPHVLGLQLWNEDPRLDSDGVATGDPGLQGVVTPFLNDGNNGFQHVKDNPGLYRELHHGAFTWDAMLRKGINEKELSKLSWVAPGQPRRVFMAGGSDAHGDLNYRRTGYMLVELAGFVDTAIGKPRNLVYVGPPQGVPLNPAIQSAPLGQRQVVAGLQSGQFSVTDGPALRIAWDVNRNGQIDEGDVPMGGQVDYDTVPPPLVVEWKSTAEFGAVQEIDLYVGVRNEELNLDATYAPPDHGVRDLIQDPVGHWMVGTTKYYTDQTTRRRYNTWNDHYWNSYDGPSLAMTPLAGEELSGRRSMTIDPAQFPLGVMNDSTFTFDRSRPADRMYVRAFARTSGWKPNSTMCIKEHGECIPRFAFTNPVWARSQFGSPTGTLLGIGGKCLDESWQSTTNGTTVLTWDCHGQPSQRWTFHPESGEIVATGLNKRLALFGWTTADGASIGIWDRDNAADQKWRFNDLELHQQGMALSVFGSNTADGAAVGMWGVYRYPDQKWVLTAAGEIRGYGDKCLDVYGWGTADGTPALMYTCNGAANQKWKVVSGGRIVGWGGKCLTVDGSSWGARVTLSTCQPGSNPSSPGVPNQKWILDGEIRGYGDHCLDVYGGSTANGTPVLSYTCYGTANQRWTYLP